jgi:hypothetical protein
MDTRSATGWRISGVSRADHGFRVRTASRHPERVGPATRSNPGPETAKADIRDEAAVAAALFGAYGAVNAVSLYVERDHVTFDAVHVEATARVGPTLFSRRRIATAATSCDKTLEQKGLSTAREP